MDFTETQKKILVWLPVAYLLTVAGFHFDGWYHAVVGRDEFWIAPHFAVLLGQILHAFLAFLFFLQSSADNVAMRRLAKQYLFTQLLFFVGFGFDESWHRIIGEETINTALVFWGPPHFVIAASLLATPFLLARMLNAVFGAERCALTLILTFGALLAFVNFYFQPLWPLGPFRVLGIYGEVAMMAGLGFVFFWALRYLRSVPLSAVFLTLIFLSVTEIMSWGSLADIPRISSVFGEVTSYPFWLTFFSFFIAAVVLDNFKLFQARYSETLGALWGGTQSALYYTGAKLWTDLSPYSIYPGWKGFSGIETSWYTVGILTIFGAIGGVVGFLIAQHYERN